MHLHARNVGTGLLIGGLTVLLGFSMKPSPDATDPADSPPLRPPSHVARPAHAHRPRHPRPRPISLNLPARSAQADL